MASATLKNTVFAAGAAVPAYEGEFVPQGGHPAGEPAAVGVVGGDSSLEFDGLLADRHYVAFADGRAIRFRASSDGPAVRTDRKPLLLAPEPVAVPVVVPVETYKRTAWFRPGKWYPPPPEPEPEPPAVVETHTADARFRR